MRRAVAIALLGLAGCYEDPGDLAPEEVLGLTILAEKPVADGASEILVELSFSGDATAGVQVQLRASAGAWLAGSGEGVETTVRIPAGRRDDLRALQVPLALPREPGELRIEAEVGGVLVTDRLTVGPALPDEIVAGTDRAVLTADGVMRANLSFDLPRAVGRPSVGTRLALAACCVGSDEAPTACPFPPPLRVPSAARIGADQDRDTLEVVAVTEPLTAEQLPAGALPMMVVAAPRAPDDPTGVTCQADQGAEVRLTVQAPEAPEPGE